jgi:antagonist of KipI
MLTGRRFVVSTQSDRMGYRLEGERLEVEGDGAMISMPTVMGAVQVPPSGQPILLMADRQTSGGYPIVGVVITADLPRAGQLAPGHAVVFASCTAAEARAALLEREEALTSWIGRPR